MMGFHTILTLAYLIPNVYLFLRILFYYIPKKNRLLFIIVYAVLFCIYPASNSFDNRSPGLPGHILSQTSDYLLPFFLYLFLSVFLNDLLLLLNRLFRIIPRETASGSAFRIKTFFTMIILSAAITFAGIINFNTIRISEYKVQVPGKSSSITDFRIAFVSDFHLNESTPVRFVEKFLRKIDSVKPDVMLFGGDIAEGDRQDEKMEHFEKLLGSIKTKYGIYGVLGNHEHYARQEKGTFFKKAGIEILRDTFVVADNAFIVAGRNDAQVRDRKSAEELMNMIPGSLPVILLDHRPTEIDEISRTHADIVLSGHTHDGQLFPINYITGAVYELSHGYLRKGNTHFFVSSGIRLWGPPVRTVGKSEIIVINVNMQ